jgi:hypothetical protein
MVCMRPLVLQVIIVGVVSAYLKYGIINPPTLQILADVTALREGLFTRECYRAPILM